MAQRKDLIEASLTVLAEMQQQGLVKHLGLSNVTPTQVAEARKIAEIVCVQNEYNIAHRADDAMIDALARDGIAYVPFFPLGGFTPLQSSTLSDVATSLNATPMQVALAWLLQRSPNILLIPGTSSVGHLRENMASDELVLTDRRAGNAGQYCAKGGLNKKPPTFVGGIINLMQQQYCRWLLLRQTVLSLPFPGRTRSLRRRQISHR